MNTEGEPTDATAHASLFAKMARVMGKMSRLKKSGVHPTQHYPFATDADVSDLVREALAEEGIAFFPSMTGVVSEKVGETKYGQPIIRSTASFVFTFACTTTGATYSCEWRAEADDSSDKGINKTATAAVKYFLLKTFLISTGDTIADSDAQDIEPDATPKKSKVTSIPTPAGAKMDIPNGANANGERRMASVPEPVSADDPYHTGRTWLPDLETELGIRGHKLHRNHITNVIKVLKDDGAVTETTSMKALIALIVEREAAKELKPTG